MASDLVDTLVQRFRVRHAGPPPWAWQCSPSIPLVGDRYIPGKSLLVYASVENLTWMNKTRVPAPFTETEWSGYRALFTSGDAWNRYRAAYEQLGRGSGDFFPWVGIQPMTNGGLFAAALYVCQRFGLLARDIPPREFLETIAVTNWCKFIVRSRVNRDYAHEQERLASSLPYVIEELKMLRPIIALVPKSTFGHQTIASAMTQASPETGFIPVHQFNSTVINCHLKRYQAVAERMRQDMAETPLAKWMANLRRLCAPNAWRYLAMLSETMGEQAGPR